VVETAAAVGVTADVAALKCGLVDEVVFYRALADEIGLPFLTKIQVADQARYPERSSPASLRWPRRSGPLGTRSRPPAGP
jgi:hypothetical protein